MRERTESVPRRNATPVKTSRMVPRESSTARTPNRVIFVTRSDRPMSMITNVDAKIPRRTTTDLILSEKTYVHKRG